MQNAKPLDELNDNELKSAVLETFQNVYLEKYDLLGFSMSQSIIAGKDHLRPANGQYADLSQAVQVAADGISIIVAGYAAAVLLLRKWKESSEIGSLGEISSSAEQARDVSLVKAEPQKVAGEQNLATDQNGETMRKNTPRDPLGRQELDIQMRRVIKEAMLASANRLGLADVELADLLVEDILKKKDGAF